MKQECVMCEKEIKGTFYFVSCKYFDCHGDNCDCGLVVGSGCVKKIPKEFIHEKTTANEWEEKVKKWGEEK